MSSISKKDTDGLKTSHWSISLFEVDALNLGIALCHESCLVPYYNAILILLILKNPLCADNIAAILGLLY